MNIFNSSSTSPLGSLGLGPDNRFHITQSWDETYSSFSGSITKLHDSQKEFYDGEFSGSVITVTNGELNSECDWAKNISTESYLYKIRVYASSSGDIFTQWMGDKNRPLDGHISMWYESGSNPGFEYDEPASDDPVL